MEVDVGHPGQQLAALSNHFTADVHAVHFAEDACKRPSHASDATSDFENPHPGRGTAAANLAHIGADTFLDRLFPGGVEFCGVPVVFR